MGKVPQKMCPALGSAKKRAERLMKKQREDFSPIARAFSYSELSRDAVSFIGTSIQMIWALVIGLYLPYQALRVGEIIYVTTNWDPSPSNEGFYFGVVKFTALAVVFILLFIVFQYAGSKLGKYIRDISREGKEFEKWRKERERLRRDAIEMIESTGSDASVEQIATSFGSLEIAANEWASEKEKHGEVKCDCCGMRHPAIERRCFNCGSPLPKFRAKIDEEEVKKAIKGYASEM